jgi:hypothetical protein
VTAVNDIRPSLLCDLVFKGLVQADFSLFKILLLSILGVGLGESFK